MILIRYANLNNVIILLILSKKRFQGNRAKISKLKNIKYHDPSDFF